jgi:tRNA pseudouridine55 synthase
LNVDKPPDMTSHDVVDAVRRVTGQRKVGHAGTLDPLATGVLLVCLGQATRVSEYLMAGRKRYRASIVLGMTTDTYDADGEIVSRDGQSDFSQQEIEDALACFAGRIQQIPPMYSAIKQGGQPLHKLARQGKTVERPPRPVEIDEIRVIDWTAPTLIVEVACSPGTYIRSLAHDLGQKLGSGAYLAALVRLRSGRFGLEDAVSLDRLEEAFEHGRGEEYLVPFDEALLDWPALVVGELDARRIGQGQAVSATSPSAQGSGALCRAYSLDGDFVALLTYDATDRLWRPKKVFLST